jgi:hypothetical protein
MKRIQISTSVSEETRQQADELIAKYGYSLRDVITLGIEKLYQEKIRKETKMKRCEKCGSTENVQSVKIKGESGTINLCGACREDGRTKAYQRRQAWKRDHPESSYPSNR